MNVFEALQQEPELCFCQRIWSNHLLKIALVVIFVFPAMLWLLVIKLLGYEFSDFWIGAYSSLSLGYLTYIYQQRYELKKKWYRALVILEAECYDLWNRVEDERQKICLYLEENKALYEFPPSLSLTIDNLHDLGRIGIKNAAFQIKKLAENIATNLRVMSVITQEHKTVIPLTGMVGDIYRACDSKSANLQADIVQIVKAIQFFLRNDKPNILVLPHYSGNKWKEWMDKDPNNVSEELTSHYANSGTHQMKQGAGFVTTQL